MQDSLLKDTIDAYDKYLQLTINRYNGGVAAKSDIALAQRGQSSTTRVVENGSWCLPLAQFEHAVAVLTGEPPANLSLSACKIERPPRPIL